MFYKKPNKRGFTLIEVMVVVLIAVMITMASVPLYTKNQDRNRYLAASGVLIELGTAMKLVAEDFPNFSGDTIAIVSNASDSDISSQGSVSAPTKDTLVAWLQANQYLNRIPFVTGKYKDYTFKVSKSGSADCSVTGITCKGTGLACMSGTNSSFPEYQCAWVDKFGLLHNNE